MLWFKKTSAMALQLCFFYIVFSLLASPLLAQTPAVKDTASRSASQQDRSDAKDDLSTPAPMKIDETGQKLGRKIDTFAERTSAWLGDWINAKPLMEITWLKWIFCLLLLLFTAIVERVSRGTIERYSLVDKDTEQTKSVRALVIGAFGKPLSLFIWLYGVYGAMTPLFVHFKNQDGSNFLHGMAQKATGIGTAVAIFWLIFRLMDIVDLRFKKWASQTGSSIDDMLAPLLGKTLRVFIVIIGSLIVVQNLSGVEIGPLLASLGVGGIAVALAAKDSIANFFGTLTILFDKPFQVGQRIVVDNADGVIEAVGFRSTRIRTLTGHLVTIPNEKLVNTSIENIGQRPHIRWLTNITITYDTPAEKVEQAVDILTAILDNHEGMHPDFPPKVFFNGFNDWSLNILMVAWYHPPNYWDMQAWQQKTCLEILRQFNTAGIDFAFPSQTVYVANDDNRQLKLKLLKGEIGGAPAIQESSTATQD